MKVAVCSRGSDAHSPVGDDFRHCPYFVVLDTNRNSICVFGDQATTAIRKAGLSAARLLKRNGVHLILANGIDARSARRLETAGIRVHTGLRGTVADAVYDFLAGRTTRVSPPDCARSELRTR